MIREEIKQLKTGGRDLRKFGLLVGGVFMALGIVLCLRHRPACPYFLAAGGFLIGFGLIAPRALKHIYIAWMAMAIVLGFVVSTVILALLFFLAITPIGLAARLFGKDFLRLKLERRAGTYWIRREPGSKTPADYERQF